METKTNTLSRSFPITAYNAKSLLWSMAFLVATIAAPAFLAHTPNNQWITGTIVNALLFLAVWKVGLLNAMIIGIVPSSIALFRGLLPAPMAAMVPFIIISNMLLVGVFFALQKKNKFLAMISASVLKFAFLLALASVIVPNIGPIFRLMSWPQLVTALAGGLIALGIIKITSSSIKAN